MAREHIFRFKQFAVINDKTAMKVGTDGVLLGAWCSVQSAKKVLDVGTGCGVIALMIAQRNKHCYIEAIDVDSNAIGEAKVNFINSPWASRLQAKITDYNQLTIDNKEQKYDLIVSNPPYFSNGVLPHGVSRTQARHATILTINDLIVHALPLLTDAGILSIVLPAEQIETVVKICNTNNFYIKRLTNVYSIEGKQVFRIMVELTKMECLTTRSHLSIQNRNYEYTEEYQAICKDFYLKF